MRTRFFRFAAAALLAAFAAAPSTAAPGDYEAARGILDGLLNSLVAEVKTNGHNYAQDQEQLFQLIEQRVIPEVDLPLLSRGILGAHWKQADEDQRRRFIKALRGMLTRTYGKSLILLSEVEKVNFFPPPEDAAARRYQTIRTEMVFSNNQAPLGINYSMIMLDGKWKIFDLIIDGWSFIKNFRQIYDQEIRNTSLEALITRLSKTGS